MRETITSKQLVKLCQQGNTEGLDGQIVIASCEDIVAGDVTSTAAYDAALDGIGSDAQGSHRVDYLPVPAAPTPSPRLRYLAHLCSLTCPRGYRMRLIDMRLALLIGLRVQEEGGEAIEYNLEQSSPFFRFPDANATFFLRELQAPVPHLRRSALNLPVNFSGDSHTTDTAWLAAKVTPSYVPTNAGTPPGAPYLWMPRMNSLIVPWNAPFQERQDAPWVEGATRVGLYVSIRQTNPLRDRGPQPQVLPVPGRPEDEFIKNNPGLVRYTGVAGMLIGRLEKSK